MNTWMRWKRVSLLVLMFYVGGQALSQVLIEVDLHHLHIMAWIWWLTKGPLSW